MWNLCWTGVRFPSPPLIMYKINKKVYNCCYKESSSGIGDILRGSCFLFSALKEYNVDFDIDFKYHPISKYIRGTNTDYEKSSIVDIDRLAKEFRNGYMDGIIHHLKEALNSQEENIFVSTNFSDILFKEQSDFFNYDISDDCKYFFQNRLQFTEDVIDYAKSIVGGQYDVHHFRCGDYDSVVGQEINNINNLNYNLDYEKMSHEITLGNSIVLSDSNKFKQYCESRKIKTSHKLSQHSSLNPGILKNIEYDDRKIFYTAVDMYILSRARRVFSYSVYPWGSGFSFWIAKIFNVPLIQRNIS